MRRWWRAICGTCQRQTTKPFLKRWIPTQTRRPAECALQVTRPVSTRLRVSGSRIISRPVNIWPARGRGPHSSSLLASSAGVRCAGAAAVCGEGGAGGAGAALVPFGPEGGAELAPFGPEAEAGLVGFGVDGGAFAVIGRTGGEGGGAGGVGGATAGGGEGGGAGGGAGGRGEGGGLPPATVPNVCAQYSVPFGAAAAPTPIARNDAPSMLALWPGELSQLCITEAADRWPDAMFSARPPAV